MEKKCWSCKHRRPVPGSAHKACHHPLVKEYVEQPMLQLISIFGSVGRLPPIIGPMEKLGIVGDPHGIRNGWFQWPWNFDPTWLLECKGYEPES